MAVGQSSISAVLSGSQCQCAFHSHSLTENPEVNITGPWFKDDASTCKVRRYSLQSQQNLKCELLDGLIVPLWRPGHGAEEVRVFVYDSVNNIWREVCYSRPPTQNCTVKVQECLLTNCLLKVLAVYGTGQDASSFCMVTLQNNTTYLCKSLTYLLHIAQNSTIRHEFSKLPHHKLCNYIIQEI